MSHKRRGAPCFIATPWTRWIATLPRRVGTSPSRNAQRQQVRVQIVEMGQAGLHFNKFFLQLQQRTLAIVRKKTFQRSRQRFDVFFQRREAMNHFLRICLSQQVGMHLANQRRRRGGGCPRCRHHGLEGRNLTALESGGEFQLEFRHPLCCLMLEIQICQHPGEQRFDRMAREIVTRHDEFVQPIPGRVQKTQRAPLQRLCLR